MRKLARLPDHRLARAGWRRTSQCLRSRASASALASLRARPPRNRSSRTFSDERPCAFGIFAIGTYLGVFLGYIFGGWVNQYFWFAHGLYQREYSRRRGYTALGLERRRASSTGRLSCGRISKRRPQGRMRGAGGAPFTVDRGASYHVLRLECADDPRRVG